MCTVTAVVIVTQLIADRYDVYLENILLAVQCLCDMCGFNGKPQRVLFVLYKTKNVGQAKATVSDTRFPEWGKGLKKEANKASRIICMYKTASCSAEYKLVY